MNDTLIKVEGVSKKFCRSLKKSLWYGMQDLGREIIGRRHGGEGELRSEEFWAVKDVSFELKRGECLGLIGPNGAGKSTLLKMLNGLIKLDGGCIEMNGKVGALIALGAGFNPILTGRENIYVNGSVLGLTKKEIDHKLEEIIDFAEIEEFIDSPVQTYSSGMQVRLGFSIATALDPDVLLLDEVLAVGDAAFRNKCYNRIGARRSECGIIFVSHSMDQVGQFCDRSLVLLKGALMFNGAVNEGISLYENMSSSEHDGGEKVFEKITPPVKFLEIKIDNDVVSYGENFLLKIGVVSEKSVRNVTMKIVFYDQTHQPCAELNSAKLGQEISLKEGKNFFQVNLGPMLLRSGKYLLGVVLTDEYGLAMLVWSYKKHWISINGITPFGPTMSLSSKIIQS